jgi:hypothetical protein
MAKDAKDARRSAGDDDNADSPRDRGHSTAPDAREAREAADAGGGREKYRDGDDARGVAGPEVRDSVGSDSRAEARGDARENVGRHARGTDTDPKGPEFNDKTKHRSDRPDAFDADLERDNHRGREASSMGDLAEDTRSGAAGMPFVQDSPVSDDDRHGWRSHARKGQAESPVELTHNEPRKKVQGHGRHDDK